MDPVEVRGLAKTFYDEARGEVPAVQGIDFECHAGEIFGLLGANPTLTTGPAFCLF